MYFSSTYNFGNGLTKFEWLEVTQEELRRYERFYSMPNCGFRFTTEATPEAELIMNILSKYYADIVREYISENFDSFLRLRTPSLEFCIIHGMLTLHYENSDPLPRVQIRSHIFTLDEDGNIVFEPEDMDLSEDEMDAWHFDAEADEEEEVNEAPHYLHARQRG